MLVILTPSAVDQNVLIRSVSRQSTAMAARRLDTGLTFLGERLSAMVWARKPKVCCFRCRTGEA